MSYEPYKATFEVGARVKVIRQLKYRNEKLLGLVGTVRRDSGSNVAVNLDTITNARSSYGCFYFKPGELLALDEFVELNNTDENVKENNMSILRVKGETIVNNSVFITRVFNARNEFLSIYGVYTCLNKARTELTKKENVEFDDIRWVWKHPSGGHYYRIDEYTVE